MIHSSHTKVQDHNDLVRDNNSCAILNVNKDELLKHRARRKLLSSKDSEIKSLSDRLQSVETLVQKLLNNYNID